MNKQKAILNSDLINPRLAQFQEEINTLLRDKPMNYFVIGNTDVEEEDGTVYP